MAGEQRVDKEVSTAVLGKRHLQCVLLFCALAVAFMMRVNLSVAIVAMMDRNATNPNFPEFTWSERTKSLALSSFFWGYFLTQIPAGQLAHRFGGKVMLTYSLAVSGVLAVCTPEAASAGNWPLLCAVRLVQGLSQGLIYPSTHTILSKWAPPEERGVLATFCYSGSQFGTILMMGVSGVLASSSLGWPSIFYVSGIASVAWVLVWIAWGAGSPSECKSITPQEKQYIDRALNAADAAANCGKATQTPWSSIFTSLPFLVLVVVQCGHNWGYWTMLTQIPSYMKSVLGKDIRSNALLSALPYLANLLLSLVFCILANALTKRQIIGLNASRKIFNSIGQWGPMVTMVALAYVARDESNLAVVLVTLTVGLNSASFLGFFVNHIDLSPNFAGILVGITNCAANMMSVIAPLVVGLVVSDAENPYQWRIIFLIAGGVYFVANLLFVVLGETEVQRWNCPPRAKKERKHIRFETIETEEDVQL